MYAFTPSSDKSEQSIEIAFDCQPGQAFILHWFPTAEYFNYSGFGNNEVWHFPVATRTKLNDDWVPQSPPQLQVDAFDLRDIINIPFIRPPVKLVEVVPVITEPEAPPTSWLLVGNGSIPIGPVQTTATVTTAYRADTGAELVIANLDGLRRVETGDIQVVGCIDLDPTILINGVPSVVNIDCDDLDLVVRIDRVGEGVFVNEDQTALSQTTVLLKTTFFNTAPVEWDVAGTECRYSGGQFQSSGFGSLWVCDFVDLSDLARYDTAKTILQQVKYCPTGIIKTDPVTIANRDVVCVG